MIKYELYNMKDMPKTITCKNCKTRMSSKQFVLGKGNKHVCKRCLEEHNEKKDKESIKNRSRKYGMHEDAYNQMFVKQEGCCAICGIHQSSMKRALSVDHNHDTGQVRGLLCNQCNIALGLMKENSIAVQNMVEYILNNLGVGPTSL